MQENLHINLVWILEFKQHAQQPSPFLGVYATSELTN